MRKGMRVIAFALAFVLTFTTLVSDTSIMSVYAEEATEVQSDEPTVEESTPVVESVEPASTDIVEEAPEKDEAPKKDETPKTEETTPTTEAASTEPTTVVEPTTEGTTVEPTTEVATTEEATTEEVTTVVEDTVSENTVSENKIEKVTIRYEAGEGGKVSVDKEEVSLTDETVTATGATATADKGYKFVNWTKESDDTVVSEDAAFVPEEKEDATYVANFKPWEAIDFGTKTVAGVNITIKAPEKAFPAGTTVTITEVKPEEVVENVDAATENTVTEEDLVAFDITFDCGREKNIQPNEAISVKFSKVELEGDTLEVFHMEDENSAADKLAVSDNDGTVTVPDATDFSIYVVSGSAYDNEENGKLNIIDKDDDDIHYSATKDDPYIMYKGETITLQFVDEDGNEDKDKAENSRDWGINATDEDERGNKENNKLKISPETTGEHKNTQATVYAKSVTDKAIMISYKRKIYKGWDHRVYIKVIDSIKVNKITATVKKDNQAVTEATVGAKGYTASAAVEPATATNKNVKWTSTKPSVATIDETSGAITFKKAGTVKFKATAQDGSKVYDETDSFTVKSALVESQFNDGKAVTAENANDTSKLANKHQGSITVETYYGDSTSAQKSETFYYIYDDTKTVDVKFTVDQSKKFKISRYEADQPTKVEANNSVEDYAATIDNVNDDTTLKLYLVAVTKTYAAEYYVLKPQRGVPGSAASQGEENYFPNSSDDGGVEGCDHVTGYKGGTITQKAKDEISNNKKEIFDVNGYGSTYVNVPSDLGDFNDKKSRIKWYTIKDQSDGIHVDGYLSGEAINVYYHANYTGNSNHYKLQPDVYSGDTINALSYEATSLTAKSGSTFVGWNTKADGTGTSYAAGASITLMTGLDLYAQWSQNNFTITSSVTNGTITPLGATIVARGGSQLFTFEVTDGYKFGSITIDGTENTDEVVEFTFDNVVADHTIAVEYVKDDAQWNTITYDGNGGTVSMGTDASTSYVVGTRQTLATPTSTARDRYTFGGWAATADRKTPITQKQIAELPDTNTVYAIWNPVVEGITVTVSDYEKVYDGTATPTAVPEENYDVTTGAIRTGDNIQVTYSTSRTDAGTTSVTADVVIKDAAGNVISDDQGNDKFYNVTVNYKIGDTDSTATQVAVTKRSITLTAGSKPFKYDGTAHTEHTYAMTDGTMAPGQEITDLTYTGSIIAGDPVSNVISGAVIKNGDILINNDNYTITYLSGTLSISTEETDLIPITIKAADATKVYDGTPLTNAGTSVSVGSLIREDNLVATAAGTVTDVTETPAVNAVNQTSVTITRNGQDVKQYYKISYATGTLQVTKRDITIEAADDEKDYDGDPLTNSNFEIVTTVAENDELAPGQVLSSVSVVGTQTQVGSSNNIASNAVIKASGADDAAEVQNNYNITYTPGILTVNEGTARDITIGVADASKKYDGTPLTAVANIISGELKKGDMLVPGTITNDIITNVGAVTSTPVIDGEGAFRIMRGGIDVTESAYNVSSASGKLEITPRVITLKTEKAEKKYDGTPLTNHKYSVSGDTLLDGAKLSEIQWTGSQTFVGRSDNTATVQVLENDAASNNYKVEYNYGELKVTKANIKITLKMKDAQKIYDGTPLISNQVEKTAGALAAGDYIDYENIQYDGSVTNVTDKSSSKMDKSSVKIYNNQTGTPVDVTENYNIKTEKGTLTIIPREVTIRTASDSKPYDGTPLVAKTATADAGTADTGLLSGHELNMERIAKLITGSIIAGDPVENTLDTEKLATTKKIIRNSNDDNKDVTKNYNMKVEYGTLTITDTQKIALTLTADSDSKTYDGTPLTKATYTIGETPEGSTEVINILKPTDKITTATFSDTSTVRDVKDGEVDNTITSVVIMNGDQDVTKYYDIKLVSGKLKIDPREVTLTIDPATQTRAYGAPDPTYTILKGNFLESEPTPFKYGYKVNASLTSPVNKPGESYEVRLSWDDNNLNYHVTPTHGALVIERATGLGLTADSVEQMYDGTAYGLANVSATLTDANGVKTTPEGTVLSYSTDNGANWKTDAPTFKDVELDADGKPVAHKILVKAENPNYVEPEVLEKTVTINPRNITFQINDASKVYGEADPTPVMGTDIVQSGDGFVSGEEPTAISSSRDANENVGTYTRRAIATLGANVNPANYKITSNDATFTITRRPITLTAASARRMFNSEPLTANAYTLTAGSLGNLVVGNDTLVNDAIAQVIVTGSQLHEGSSANVITSVTINGTIGAAVTDTTANYEITLVNGTLTVDYVSGGNGTNATTGGTTAGVLGAARTPEAGVLGATRTIPDDPTALAATPQGEVLGADRPQTGDNANAYAYFLAILASTGVLAGWYVRRKKSENK